jgi:signal transduction histidine kinase/CheY-like chemotaxis protein/HPt (histidine-containing phosphotransfer) domain-containing protein
MQVPADQLIGQTSGAWLDSATARRHAEADFALLSHPGRQTYESRQTLPGNRVMDTLIHKATLQAADGSIAGLVATVVDISPQRNAVRATVEAKEAAESANAAKSAFLATMSHEIRTPMNGVLGMAELLAHSKLNPEQGHLVHTVRESALSLLRIIDDILDFSKVEAGRMELEHLPLDVTPLVEGVCTALAPMALARGVLLQVQLAADVNERVLGDAGRLRQVLNNLVGNAIKFSAPGDSKPDGGKPGAGKAGAAPGRVALRVSMYAPDLEGDGLGDPELGAAGAVTPAGTGDVAAPWLRFEVQDNGVGMDSATLARLFTPFTQAEVSTRRRFGGTGLGLAISRRLVELMGGRIAVTSQLGHGATFSVTVPLLATADQPVLATPDLQGLRCCIVADPGLPAHDLHSWLQQAGAQVRVLAPGEPVQDSAAAGAGTPDQGPWVVVRTDTVGSDGGDLAAAAAGHGAADRSAADHSAADPSAADPITEADGAHTLDLRYLLIRRGRRGPARVVTPNAATLDLLCKGPFLRAVAMLAGRASPEPDLGTLHNVTTDLSHDDRVDPPTPEQARQRGQLILVAEDDPINRAVIERQLSLLGFAAEIAEDGAQALRMWRSGRYALLLSDLHMPQLDGYALAEAIRGAEQASVPALPRLPILALTANALKGEALRARASGMDDYLTKPVPLKLLQAALQQWLPAPITTAPPVLLPAVPAQAGLAGLADTAAVLDVQQLRDLVGDDTDTVRELLHDYAQSAAEHTAELRLALLTADRALAAAVAHKLKSASRSVGAMALADVCEQIESQRGTGTPAGLADADAAADAGLDTPCATCSAWLQVLDSTWLATQAQLQHAVAELALSPQP